jgi:hypothetical protein
MIRMEKILQEISETFSPKNDTRIDRRGATSC